MLCSVLYRFLRALQQNRAQSRLLYLFNYNNVRLKITPVSFIKSSLIFRLMYDSVSFS